MHPGKQTCELLKSIRVKLAEANGIKYEPHECTNEEACAGTCPLCDQELRWLDEEIYRKLREGEDVTFDVLTGAEQDVFFGSADELEIRFEQDLDKKTPTIPELLMGIPAHLYGDERDVFVLKTAEADPEPTDESLLTDDKNDQD